MCPRLQTKWHSQSAMAAAEERERRIAVLQQEVDSLKARLWDSAARIGDLEKYACKASSEPVTRSICSRIALTNRTVL